MSEVLSLMQMLMGGAMAGNHGLTVIYWDLLLNVMLLCCLWKSGNI